MIRLAMLSFKESGTKISIFDNKISFNEPHLLQGPIRWSQGDKKDDLHNLYRPIIKALEWYDYSDKEIENIFRLAINGIDKLKDAYVDNSSITHSLEYYKNSIEDNLNSIKSNEKNESDNIVVNKIYMDLKKLWNKNEISIVNNIFSEIKNTEFVLDINSLMDALNSIIYIKEEKVKTIILSHTTLL